MTWVATTSPTRFPAAAPASTALRTAATSPRTMAVTRPASIFSQPTRRTFAAFTIASAASIIATRPMHSTIPSASIKLFPDDRHENGEHSGDNNDQNADQQSPRHVVVRRPNEFTAFSLSHARLFTLVGGLRK